MHTRQDHRPAQACPVGERIKMLKALWFCGHQDGPEEENLELPSSGLSV